MNTNVVVVSVNSCDRKALERIENQVFESTEAVEKCLREEHDLVDDDSADA